MGSSSSSDAENYRGGYDGMKNPPLDEQSANFEFYQNRLRSEPDGDLIDNIHLLWRGNYDLLEAHHGYIQWLFPIREPGMNPDAQPLTLAEAAEIKRDPVCSGRVLVSYRLMLDFYGVQLDDEATGAVSRTPHYAERFAHLNFSFHNYLRITRILKCLGELGFEHFKAPLVQFFLEEMLQHGQLPNAFESCRDYWLPVLRDDAQRKELEGFVALRQGEFLRARDAANARQMHSGMSGY